MSDELENQIKNIIEEAEKSAKCVWEIDGINVYVRDILINNNEITVDWFILDNSIDKAKLGIKVETLAAKIIGDVCPPSKNLFSQISFLMKNIFVSRGRT